MSVGSEEIVAGTVQLQLEAVGRGKHVTGYQRSLNFNLLQVTTNSRPHIIQGN